MELPVAHMPLPARVRYETPLTDLQLYQFSATNDVVWIEREPDGSLYLKPIGGGHMSLRTMVVLRALARWNREDQRGKAYSGAGWILPDGSMRGAPLSWLSKECVAQVRHDDKAGFAHLAPDFVVEVLSVLDDRDYLEAKMEQWIANGVSLAWLIDGDARQITIFQPGAEPSILNEPSTLSGSGLLDGFVIACEELWAL